MLKITAVICTYSRYDLLPKAIESLRQQTLPQGQYEIIIVDNLPGTEEFSYYKKKYDQLENIKYCGEPIAGLSNARNCGVKKCKSRLIAFMDDDAIADSKWLATIVAAFETYGDAAGIVGGKVRPVWEIPRPSWLVDSLLGNLSVVDWGGTRPRKAKSHEWFAGTNISYRLSLLEKYGGFTVGLGRNGEAPTLMGNEEIAVTNRLNEAGYLSIYAPGAIVDHLVPASRLTQSWFRKRAAWQAVSDYLMEGHAAEDQTSGAWEGIVSYINSLPPEERSMRGLFRPTDDQDSFHWQTGSVYNMTRLLLSSFDLQD